VVESVKAASDIYSPVSGEVVAVNETLSDAPEKVNEEPYSTWMFRLKPDNAAEMEGLLDAAAYQKIADAES
jgi:glycine cleavage system H protein